MVYLSAWDNCMTFPLGQGSQPMKKGWNEDWEKRLVQSEEALPHWTGLIIIKLISQQPSECPHFTK